MDGHNFQTHGLKREERSGLMSYYQNDILTMERDIYREYLSDRKKCVEQTLDGRLKNAERKIKRVLKQKYSRKEF